MFAVALLVDGLLESKQMLQQKVVKLLESSTSIYFADFCFKQFNSYVHVVISSTKDKIYTMPVRAGGTSSLKEASFPMKKQPAGFGSRKASTRDPDPLDPTRKPAGLTRTRALHYS
ncbi:hypothetical protein GGX14DRAFT_403253 [Mycena pura]|uniref:Uncharacterized protein n=1 Tax=Mycena pura TaxID=153505 RepID=A0AAD6UYE9_9AGAR|nr:hypothetical protein GGX14DRAFT_403253 [Mycena pura]